MGLAAARVILGGSGAGPEGMIAAPMTTTTSHTSDVQVLTPSSAEEAVRAFGDGGGVVVVGGGTIVLPLVTTGRVRPQRALVLARAGLDAVERADGRVTVGAGASVDALAGEPAPLGPCAANVADREVRAQATVGGNLCARAGAEFPSGDLQGALLALGARVRSAGRGGEAEEELEEFLAREPGTRLLLSVSYDASRRGAFAALRRPHAHHYTPLAVSASVAAGGGDLRVAATGVAPTGVRLRGVEESRDPERALDGVEPPDDALASSWYRRKMLPVLVRRVLSELEGVS